MNLSRGVAKQVNLKFQLPLLLNLKFSSRRSYKFCSHPLAIAVRFQLCMRRSANQSIKSKCKIEVDFKRPTSFFTCSRANLLKVVN